MLGEVAAVVDCSAGTECTAVTLVEVSAQLVLLLQFVTA